LFLNLCVPRHDQKLVAKANATNANVTALNMGPGGRLVKSQSVNFPVLETQQFGVTLDYIRKHNNGDPIPPLVTKIVTFLSNPDGWSITVS
jgi:hypothetical protein